MDISETVQKVLQEVVVTDLGKINDENSKILAILDLTNKRLDDVNTHLVDQSRRIDEVNKRIDDIRAELTLRFDEIHSDLINRLDANNARIDRFFETAVTKYEHGKMEERVTRLEHDIDVLRRQMPV